MEAVILQEDSAAPKKTNVSPTQVACLINLNGRNNAMHQVMLFNLKLDQSKLLTAQLSQQQIIPHGSTTLSSILLFFI